MALRRNDNITMLATPNRSGSTTFRITDASGRTFDGIGTITEMEIRTEHEADVYDVGGPFAMRIPGGVEKTMTFTVHLDSSCLPRGGGYEAVHPASDYNSGNWASRAQPVITHAYIHNPEEPGICADRSCGMWPEHHDHEQPNGRRVRCVCSQCMPDADRLPDDQHTVNARSSSTYMQPGPESMRSHP